MFMGTVDTLMVGRVSPTALAAVAIGNLDSVIGIFFGQGVLLGLDPLINQAVGAGDRPAVVRAFQRALVLAVVLAIRSRSIICSPAHPDRVRQPPDIIPLAAAYHRWLVPSVLPFLAFGVMRGTMQAFHRLRPVVITIVVANLANALLNWMFIYGNLGAPALGVPGSALATTVSRWLMGRACCSRLHAMSSAGASVPGPMKAHDGPRSSGCSGSASPLPCSSSSRSTCFGGVAFLAGAGGVELTSPPDRHRAGLARLHGAARRERGRDPCWWTRRRRPRGRPGPPERGGRACSWEPGCHGVRGAHVLGHPASAGRAVYQRCPRGGPGGLPSSRWLECSRPSMVCRSCRSACSAASADTKTPFHHQPDWLLAHRDAGGRGTGLPLGMGVLGLSWDWWSVSAWSPWCS